jgi:SAM-dependent methyltransferase
MRKRNEIYSARLASVTEKGVILDIGVGEGLITNNLGRNTAKLVVGVDVHKWVFRRKMSFHRVVADAQNLPFRNSVFDACVLISCLEHLNSPQKCIREVSRVTKQKGQCIVQLPNLQWLVEPHTRLPFFFLLPERVQSLVKRNIDDTLNMSVTLSRVLAWFGYLGFQNTERDKIYHNLPLFYELLPWPAGWFLTFCRSSSDTNHKLL